MDKLRTVIQTAINPALAMLPSKMNTPQAVAMLLAIGLQESEFIYHRQIRGPARGYWMFEQGGGVRGVLTHSASAKLALQVCVDRSIAPSSPAVYAALEHDDVLAAAFARLLLWTDPKPLPALGDADGAWGLYSRTWRPGYPRPQDWPGNYAQALGAVQEGAR